MSDIEELKRRKEELLLRKEIAKLEQSERKGGFWKRIPYVVGIPLGLGGLSMILVGLSEGDLGVLFLGIILLIPFLGKFINR